MTLQTWLLFCATEAVLCFAPGPAVLLVVSQSLSRGAWAGLAASLGILAANTAYFALSATSIGAVLVRSSLVFSIIRWAGAGYLIWIGARMIWTGAHADSNRLQPDVPSTKRSAFSIAVVTQGANPKALVFFTAILPQFINPAAPVVAQIVILGISSVVIEFVVLSLYVATCHTARGWIRKPQVAGLFERAGGALLVAAGARLAVMRQT